jgi:cysteine desulfurase / selenocysteine lyase
MAIDVHKVRQDTPGCRSGLIHLNNAGASLMPQPVIDAVLSHLALEVDQGGYEAEASAQQELAAFYMAAAQLVGGRAEEIAFADSATRAWQAVFHAFDWRPGDEVLTAPSEYASHMITFRQAENRYGTRTVIAPDTSTGEVDVAGLAALITPRTRLICISHMPTNDGLVNPVTEIGALARSRGLPFMLDACQSVGQLPIDVQSIGCTMLSATGRKYLRGPRGTGFLWISGDWADRLSPAALDVQSARWSGPTTIELAAGARRFELWERSVAGQIGLGVACDYANATGVAEIWQRIQTLSEYLRATLAEVPGISVQDQGGTRSGIVTFSHGTLSAETVVGRLRRTGRINTSVSSTQLTRRALLEKGVTQLVRASVHAYNTVEEIDHLAASLADMFPTGARPGTRLGQSEPDHNKTGSGT